MQAAGVDHLPVASDGKFLGLVSRPAIDLADNTDLPLTEIPELHASLTAVRQNQPIFEVLRVMLETGYSTVPVLDDEGVLMGSIGQAELLQGLGYALGIDEPGALIVLEVRPRDYSLREIASIVESEGYRILDMFVGRNRSAEQFSITLKINDHEVTPLLMAFERYGYNVSDIFVDERGQHLTRERYDALIRYLNV
jgi:CBS domain-containing protein